MADEHHYTVARPVSTDREKSPETWVALGDAAAAAVAALAEKIAAQTAPRKGAAE